MAHQVVVVADQLVDMVAGDAAESGVGVGDDAAQVSGGDELFVGGELHFTVHDLCVFAGHRGKLRSSGWLLLWMSRSLAQGALPGFIGRLILPTKAD